MGRPSPVLEDEELFLRLDVKAEPCVNRWIAWDQLVPPHTAALNVIGSHIPIMESYIADPVTHEQAVKNPSLLGGPWVDYETNRVPEIAELLRTTRRHPLVELGTAIRTLDTMLRKEARGGSLESLYPRVPQALRGYVELVYDLNHSPAIRFLEGLLYRSRFYDRGSQAFSLSQISADRRTFQWSTPVLPTETSIYAQLPFDDPRVDALFRTELAPQRLSAIEALELVPDPARLHALFTARPPSTPPRYGGDDIRIRYFGHACLLIETKNVSILTDPFVSYTYPTTLERFSLADLPAHIDYALITHCHNDHIELETLLRLRHRIGQVVVPRSAGRRREDPSLRGILQRMGFRDVIELADLDSIEFPSGSVTALPFLGEHCDLDIQSKTSYLVQSNGRSIMCAADSCNLEPELYERLRRIFGEIDALFLGMECDGAPLSWGYGSLFTHAIEYEFDQSRRLSGSNCARATAIVKSIRPSHVYVYAMGQEPWLNHVLALDLENSQRSALTESDRLIKQLRASGITAERPYAKMELELASITAADHAQGGDMRDYTGQRFTHERIEEQVDRTPEADAVTFERTTLSYRELDARANRLAHHLISLGARPDAPIGVCLERSLDLIVALLAIMKAGAPYVPIDPNDPALRRAAITSDSNCELVIDATWLATHGANIATRSPLRPARAIDGDHAAYVIFTSGSSGSPKGVVVTHAGLRNRLLWVTDTFGFDATDVILQKTPFTFDVSVFELFYAFTIGARLVVTRPDGHRNPSHVGALIRDEGVTFAHFVPSMLGPFVDELHRAPCPSLRRVFASGEALSIDLVRAFAANSGAELHNLYGPTEATVDVSWWPCAASDDTVPIGHPISNTRLYVLDPEQQPVPDGVTGELFISGVQLARGYSRRPGLTAERFLPDPFTPGERMYRTGDLARRRRDGAIEYLGRIDHQVKIRGLRIELGELEGVLLEHPQIRSTVVVVRDEPQRGKVLVAYVTGQVDPRELRPYVAQRVPEYMVPSAFVLLEALPLTPNGKVDRAALPAPTNVRAEIVAPRNEIEERLAIIWQEVLGVAPIGVRDSFFELGGHSLLAVRLLSRVEEAFEIAVVQADLFTRPTIAELGDRILELTAAEVDPELLARLIAESVE
jgi:amino acid adenylation domain-containing protein